MDWTRRFPNSNNNFDLIAARPHDLDVERLKTLLEAILNESHRSLTLSSKARVEFERWLRAPETPLKSEAYVLLSNWFLTDSGDRSSTVASNCEDLWDALFPCRPSERLSSPEAGRNHIMIPAAFESFWRKLTAVGAVSESSVSVASESRALVPSGRIPTLSGDILKARFTKGNLHCELEGSPSSVAEFMKIVEHWNQ